MLSCVNQFCYETGSSCVMFLLSYESPVSVVCVNVSVKQCCHVSMLSYDDVCRSNNFWVMLYLSVIFCVSVVMFHCHVQLLSCDVVAIFQ